YKSVQCINLNSIYYCTVYNSARYFLKLLFNLLKARTENLGRSVWKKIFASPEKKY
ncbi:hypothetical protein BgiBS90_033979, partial [Biomphalaria glabrata]